MYIVYYRYSKYHLHKLSTHLPSSSSWNLPGNFFQKKQPANKTPSPAAGFSNLAPRCCDQLQGTKLLFWTIRPWMWHLGWEGIHEENWWGITNLGGGKSVNLETYIYFFLGGYTKNVPNVHFWCMELLRPTYGLNWEVSLLNVLVHLR